MTLASQEFVKTLQRLKIDKGMTWRWTLVLLEPGVFQSFTFQCIKLSKHQKHFKKFCHLMGQFLLSSGITGQLQLFFLKICSLVQWMNIWNPLDYDAFNILATIIFQAGGRELSNILNLLLSETIHNLLAFWSMKEIDRSVCNKCLKGTNNSSKYFWNRQLLFL